MRRSEREITERQEIDAIIHDCEVCRVAMAKDDVPYVVPVSFGYDGRSIYFHTARSGMKIEYLTVNPAVCFEMERGVRLLPHPDEACDYTFAFESLIGFGRVIELVDAGEKRVGLDAIMAHYAEGQWTYDDRTLNRVRVWRVYIDRISGKRLRP
jgi:nitroimidazol reductase NimA-like FMN-containing flavoprotein (pyridoxamine 5'-phosphate oxidase superfamily)